MKYRVRVNIIRQVYNSDIGISISLFCLLICCLLHCFRSNKTSIDNKLIEDVNQAWTLIEIADMLYLEHAAQKCDDFIIGQVTPQNCVEICHLADTFHRSNILLEVVRKIALFRYCINDITFPDDFF